MGSSVLNSFQHVAGVRSTRKNGTIPSEGNIVRSVGWSVACSRRGSVRRRSTSLSFRWQSRCRFAVRVVHLRYLPLACAELMETAGAQALNISCSGLDQSEMCWMRRLARALGIILAVSRPLLGEELTDCNAGITLTTTFSRRCTHLLCPPRTGPKFDKAGEWGIPVVGMEWVQLMATKGVVPDVNVGAKMDETQERAVMKSARAKGKEKEKEEDYGIVDITNSECLSVAHAGAMLMSKYQMMTLRILLTSKSLSLRPMVSGPFSGHLADSLANPGITNNPSSPVLRRRARQLPQGSSTTFCHRRPSCPSRCHRLCARCARSSGTGRRRGYLRPTRLRL
jgi:hypothetical protein